MCNVDEGGGSTAHTHTHTHTHTHKKVLAKQGKKEVCRMPSAYKRGGGGRKLPGKKN